MSPKSCFLPNMTSCHEVTFGPAVECFNKWNQSVELVTHLRPETKIPATHNRKHKGHTHTQTHKHTHFLFKVSREHKEWASRGNHLVASGGPGAFTGGPMPHFSTGHLSSPAPSSLISMQGLRLWSASPLKAHLLHRNFKGSSAEAAC